MIHLRIENLNHYNLNKGEDNMKYTKSPLNYVGGKYKLLNQIIPLFPDDIDTFVDLFSGGCNVGINIEAKNIICNDTEQVVIDLLNSWKELDSSEALNILESTISKYQLSKINEEGFKQIRLDYNNGNKSWNMFYAMLTHAFNYQIRFNKDGNYNMPFGRNRSSFNPTLKKNFIEFIDKLNEKNIDFISMDFSKVDLSMLTVNDIVYCDPPYLITCASYNEQGGWNETKERELLSLLDELNERGIKFALSNVLENKGKTNEILKEWSNKYTVHHLNNTYGNCNYHAKDKSVSTTDEVLITNYSKE